MGTMIVDIDVQGTLSQEEVEAMFKKAIAAALEIPAAFVSKLTAFEISKGSRLRRLQSIQKKQYEVSYEVIVPSYMDADAVVEKANRIAVSGAAESTVFREALTATSGVTQVGEIVSKTPAHYKSVDKTLTTADPDKDEKSRTSLVIGLILAFMVVLCLVTSVILLKRRNTMIDSGAGASTEPTSQAVKGGAGENSNLVDGVLVDGVAVSIHPNMETVETTTI